MPDDNKKQNVFSKLRSFFNIGITKDKKKEPRPAKVNKKTGEKRTVHFPTDMEKFYKYWLNDCHDTAQTIKDRFERYDDMEYMVYNDSVISMAAEMYADEATQAESQNQMIVCEAEDDGVESYINKYIEKLGFSVDVVKEIIRNMVIYGDHFNVNAVHPEKGITEITPVDVHSVTERVEFNLLNEQKKMYMKQANIIGSQFDRMKSIVQTISDEDSKAKKEGTDYIKLFQNYLFGFQMEGGFYLPPWAVSHFRLFSSHSEFAPYGRPLFIHALSPFRQLKASMNLMALSRASNIPKEIFNVQTEENMNAIEKWKAVDEAYDQYNNLGLSSTVKNDMGVGTQIWLADGVLDFDTKSPNISLDEIADVEMLRDNMIIATRIPKGYLIVDRASFGTSGQALLQQFKPFGRAVFTLQSAFLKELTHLIKLHFLITGKFEGEKTNFELSMNFPVTEETNDRISTKNDTLRLASDVVRGITDAIGTRDGLPPEVVKGIFKKLTFLDDEDVEDWLNNATQTQEESVNNDKKYWENNKDKFKSRITDQLIKSTWIRTKKKHKMTEGVSNKRHYITSWNHEKQYENIYNLFKKTQEGQLQEDK